MSFVCPPDYIDLAQRLADAAGEVIRTYFRTPISVDDKADASPVTIADKESEGVMRAILETEVPDHGIVGEEHGRDRDGAEYVWVLDPIDGTKAFISGLPTFGTLIALLRDGVPVLGVINQPISGERWIGAAGHPTTLNGAPIRTRACDTLAKATLFTTDPALFGATEIGGYRRLDAAVKLRRYGIDCYAYALLATGFVDLVAECKLQLYDYAALVPVVEGAGGVMTDWRGQPLTGMTGDQCVLAAGSAQVHAQALEALNDGSPEALK